MFNSQNQKNKMVTILCRIFKLYFYNYFLFLYTVISIV
ncbi:hypothetical protein A1OE_472 [Candidatus Endolissoclinum faulkneri L2]|uniref:Uncharacterized protein n=1 Tax=Candidatus Endolissoclinum faulkneri L2 TaxID=1193729 RepID=K7YGC8_9PROT|nr:hypothetical protein A1OE_472 [Candidatus Endolissoclinum faulkneri L2]